VAISNIARAVHKASPDQYLAGMWRKDLETMLSWCCLRVSGVIPRSGTYRAPSWSWASVDGPVNARLCSDDNHKLCAHVLDASVDSSGPDDFGQLCGGILTISYAVMLSARLFVMVMSSQGTAGASVIVLKSLLKIATTPSK
jgi:hypothetical protein